MHVSACAAPHSICVHMSHTWSPGTEGAALWMAEAMNGNPLRVNGRQSASGMFTCTYMIKYMSTPSLANETAKNWNLHYPLQQLHLSISLNHYEYCIIIIFCCVIKSASMQGEHIMHAHNAALPRVIMMLLSCRARPGVFWHCVLSRCEYGKQTVRLFKQTRHHSIKAAVPRSKVARVVLQFLLLLLFNSFVCFHRLLVFIEVLPTEK